MRNKITQIPTVLLALHLLCFSRCGEGTAIGNLNNFPPECEILHQEFNSTIWYCGYEPDLTLPAFTCTAPHTNVSSSNCNAVCEGGTVIIGVKPSLLGVSGMKMMGMVGQMNTQIVYCYPQAR